MRGCIRAISSLAGKAPKQPYAFELVNGSPFAFAGIWDGWKDAQVHWLQSFAVVLCSKQQRLRGPGNRAGCSSKRPKMPKTTPLKKRPAGFIEAMECLPVSSLPEEPQWSYEIKLDGYRLQAVQSGRQTTLYSRRENVLNGRLSGCARTPSAAAWCEVSQQVCVA